MDTDAVHFWLDELHGELCSRDQVHFMLPHGRETSGYVTASATGATAVSVLTSHQVLQLLHGSHTSAYCPLFLGTSLRAFRSSTYLWDWLYKECLQDKKGTAPLLQSPFCKSSCFSPSPPHSQTHDLLQNTSLTTFST